MSRAVGALKYGEDCHRNEMFTFTYKTDNKVISLDT